MKLAIKIIRNGLSSLWRHGEGVAMSALVILSLMIVLEIIFPSAFNPEDDSVAAAMEAGNRVTANTLVQVLPLLAMTSVFLVFAHRKILLPPDQALKGGGLEVKKTELTFMFWSLVISILTAVPIMVLYFGLGRLLFALQIPFELWAGFFTIIFAIATAFIVIIVTYRFVLFAPLVVLGQAWPLKTAWNLSRSRFVTIATLIAAPMIVHHLMSGVFGFISDQLPLYVSETNLTGALLFNASNLLIAAYAAMVLSHAYLEFTREDSVVPQGMSRDDV